MLNENGDREVDYTLNDLDTETGSMRAVATYYGARRMMDKLAGVEVQWPQNKGPPPDKPFCGYMGEAAHCQEQGERQWLKNYNATISISFPTETFPIWASILITLLALTIIGLIVAVFVFKKVRLEQHLNDNWWKVNYDEIFFPNLNKSGHKSAMSLTLSETEGYQSGFQSGKTSSLRVGSIGHSLISAAGELDTVNVGLYKGVKIAYKPLQVKKITINRQLLIELKQVNPFRLKPMT